MNCILCHRQMENDEIVNLFPSMMKSAPPPLDKCECGVIYIDDARPHENGAARYRFDGKDVVIEGSAWIIDSVVYTQKDAERVAKLKAFL